MSRPGTFKKGQSGNPGGRPKDVGEVKDLARKHTKDAVERLVHWLHSDNPKASVSAASVLLDRGWGKAAQSVAHTGPDGEGPVKHIVETRIVDPRSAD